MISKRDLLKQSPAVLALAAIPTVAAVAAFPTEAAPTENPEPMRAEEDIETLFHRWKDAERRGDLAVIDDDPVFDEYRSIVDQIVSLRVRTPRDLAIMLLVATDRFASSISGTLEDKVKSLAGEKVGA